MHAFLPSSTVHVIPSDVGIRHPCIHGPPSCDLLLLSHDTDHHQLLFTVSCWEGSAVVSQHVQPPRHLLDQHVCVPLLVPSPSALAWNTPGPHVPASVTPCIREPARPPAAAYLGLCTRVMQAVLSLSVLYVPPIMNTPRSWQIIAGQHCACHGARQAAAPDQHQLMNW